MKTITMYELLGLVNDNKAPKKIKISELIYDFDDERQMYFDEEVNELSDNIYLTKNLNHPVEILEEEKKIPEKLPYYSMEKIQKAKNKDEWLEERIKLLEKRVNDLHIKMNDLLDYLKNKGNK